MGDNLIRSHPVDVIEDGVGNLAALPVASDLLPEGAGDPVADDRGPRRLKPIKLLFGEGGLHLGQGLFGAILVEGRLASAADKKASEKEERKVTHEASGFGREGRIGELRF